MGIVLSQWDVSLRKSLGFTKVSVKAVLNMGMNTGRVFI